MLTMYYFDELPCSVESLVQLFEEQSEGQTEGHGLLLSTLL